MKNKKYQVIKYLIVCITLLIIVILGFLIYKNLFLSSNSKRFENIENYVFTTEEKDKIKDIFSEVESIDKIEVYTSSKIIKVYINISEDIEFSDIESYSESIIDSISEENLTFYDVEFFVDCSNESEVYPKIGYKHKSNSEFSWSR